MKKSNWLVWCIVWRWKLMTCLSNRTENTRNQTTHNSATFNNHLVQCSRVVVLGIVRRRKRVVVVFRSCFWLGGRVGEWRWKQSDYGLSYEVRYGCSALSLTFPTAVDCFPPIVLASETSGSLLAAPSPVNKPINLYAPFVQAFYKLDNSACVWTVPA